ncbi:MAG: polysaccharide biosynthesis/export family protein [Candidatus Omnitrophota bacterium]|jgi:polysaccharide export outer membrane protein
MNKTIILTVICFLVTSGGCPLACFAEAPNIDSERLIPSRKIQPGDTIKINVWKYSDLNATIVVSSAGTMSYSYIGEVQVAGKTPEELRDLITRQLDQNYIANPRVDVTIESELPTIYVVGEVVRPGSYKYEINLDPLKAVALAGGLSNFASRTALIIRRDPNGIETQIKVKLNELMKANEERAKYQLLPGDMVVVKRGWF